MPNKPKNAYLAQLEQRMQDRARVVQYVNERQSLDALIIAANEEFGFGAERMTRLIAKYIDTRKMIADMFIDDRYTNNDKDLVYSKAKLDNRLQQIMGVDYPCHEDRYVVDIRKTMFDGGIVVGVKEDADNA